jgi:TPR repeat protein
MVPQTRVGPIFLLFAVLSFALSCFAQAVFDKKPQFSRNFPQIVQKAQQGDRHAQFLLGLAYESGSDIEKNYAEAVRWYRKAADSGDSGAQNNLGSMYGRGLGVQQDDAEAMKWYLRAATDDHPAAQSNIGFMYATGRAAIGRGRTTPDPAEALNWYRKAATKNYAPAEFNLGLAYLHGTGTQRNIAEALRWFHKAAEHGSLDARKNLTVLEAAQVQSSEKRAELSSSGSVVPSQEEEPFH